MFDRIMCVLVRIKVRGHLVMSIIQFMNLISVHFWTRRLRPSEQISTEMKRSFPLNTALAWINMSLKGQQTSGITGDYILSVLFNKMFSLGPPESLRCFAGK